MGDQTLETVNEWLRLWNEQALEELTRVAAPGYVHHTMAGVDVDISGFTRGFADVLAAFPT